MNVCFRNPKKDHGMSPLYVRVTRSHREVGSALPGQVGVKMKVKQVPPWKLVKLLMVPAASQVRIGIMKSVMIKPHS